MEVYPLIMTNSSLLNMTIEIVDLPMKHGDFPWFFVAVYQLSSYVPQDEGLRVILDDCRYRSTSAGFVLKLG